MQARGFILQASYRILAHRNGARVPVVHLFGRLEDGKTFLVRDWREQPHFFIAQAGASLAKAHGVQCTAATERNFAGALLCRVNVASPADMPGVRARLNAVGIETFEADLRFATRYLIDRGIRGGCVIEGEPSAGHGIDWIFDDPAIGPAQVSVSPRLLSFDIETDRKAERLLAIALYGVGVDEVLIVDGRGRSLPARAVGCADEYAALDALCTRVAELDPDVLTGWNCIDFDLSVLQRIAKRLQHPLELGRTPGALRVRKAEGYFGSGQAITPGRVVLDGIDLLRGAFVRMQDYALDAVAREVLGEGKALTGAARDRVSEIEHNYRHDLTAFARYARTDARLAYDIVSRLKLVELALARSQLTGMTPDRVAASIASFDFLYLSALHQRAIVAPDVRGADNRVHAAQQGGHVLEPETGLHRNVWVFDFKSLYPSIIRTFNIDPLGYVADPAPGSDVIDTRGGAFSREPAILPGLLDLLFPQREAAKRAGDSVASNAIKILMNSFYGVLGTSACRFHNPALANAITGQGRDILLWSKKWFEQAGYRVLYGDTDSLFVSAGTDDTDSARVQGPRLVHELNTALGRYIQQRWRLSSKLELKFEKLYLKLLLPKVRRGIGGARKRYVGQIDGHTELDFVGMEMVRRDWTLLAKQVQGELYRRLFADEPVAGYLASVVTQVRGGALDELLVYRKQLRKDADAYTATSPPHVVAARKSTQRSHRLVSYVITLAGAEPLGEVKHPIDREHYVEKQVRPIAEPVLDLLGQDFDRAVGDDSQLSMRFC